MPSRSLMPRGEWVPISLRGPAFLANDTFIHLFDKILSECLLHACPCAERHSKEPNKT